MILSRQQQKAIERLKTAYGYRVLDVKPSVKGATTAVLMVKHKDDESDGVGFFAIKITGQVGPFLKA